MVAFFCRKLQELVERMAAIAIGRLLSYSCLQLFDRNADTRVIKRRSPADWKIDGGAKERCCKAARFCFEYLSRSVGKCLNVKQNNLGGIGHDPLSRESWSYMCLKVSCGSILAN